jgi:hypothetical protein
MARKNGPVPAIVCPDTKGLLAKKSDRIREKRRIE